MKIATVKRVLLISVVMIFISLRIQAQIQKGRYSLGYSVGYTTATKTGLLNADFRYCLTNAFRISPSISQFVNDDGYKGSQFDTNFHYVIALNDVYAIYPLVGVNFSYWDYYDKKAKSYRKGESYWGPNVGFGVEIYVVDELVVGLDVKYNIPKKHDQLLLGLRIAYCFIP